MSKKSGKKKHSGAAKKAKPKADGKKYGPFAAVVIVIAVVVGLIAFSSAGKDGPAGAGSAANSGAAGTSQTAAADKIEMTDVKATVANGSITVSENEVRKAGIVYFEYKGAKDVNLLAYAGPSGKIVAAVSLCEPCRGQKFHIEGTTLVCNTCGSVWELETHNAVSGACTKYPPEILQSETVNGQVVIPEKNVLAWEPRV
ncbi:MAG: Fe-S-containing protein [Actinomycetota bacterium]